MKVAIVRGVNELFVEDIPMPKAGKYAALCKIICGATCTATDLHIIEHNVIDTEYPTLLGHESIGRVLEIGEGVRSFRIGDRLTNVGMPAVPRLGLHSFGGGYAQYGLAFDFAAMREDGIEEKDFLLYTGSHRVPSCVIPSDIPDYTAAMFITWRETFSYISKMGIREGMRVLIIGSGANGLSFMNHAMAHGCSVVGVGSASRNGNAMACGANHYFDYKDPALRERLEDVAQDGFHLVVDAIGLPHGLNAYLPFIVRDAVVGIYGIEGNGNMSLDPFASPHSFRFYNDGYSESDAHGAIVKNVRKGILKTEHYLDINHPYPLDNIRQAFDDLKNRACVFPKALIVTDMS